MYLRQPQVEPGSRCACEVGMRAQRKNKKNIKGANVRSPFGSEQPSESGRFLEPSGRVVLECLCGGKLVLLGQEQDCQKEGCTVFRCECGRELTLAEDRADESPGYREVVETEHKAPRSV